MSSTQPLQFPLNAAERLSTLSRAEPDALKAAVELIIPELEPIAVVYNRTGLVMLPYTDSAQGKRFHIGEVLIAEARVVTNNAEGYGACLGHDVETALAIALIDAAMATPLNSEQTTPAYIAIITNLLNMQRAAQLAADETLLQAVELTRAEIETF